MPDEPEWNDPRAPDRPEERGRYNPTAQLLLGVAALLVVALIIRAIN